VSRSPFGPAADAASHPAAVPGAIVGPGGAFDSNAAVVDARHALLLERVEVRRTMLGGLSRTTQALDARPGYIVTLGGIRGKEAAGSRHLVVDSANQASHTLLQSPDGVASIIAETMALLSRHDAVYHRVFFDLVGKRLERLAADDERADRRAERDELIADPDRALQPDYLEVMLLTERDDNPAPPVVYSFTGRINLSSQRATNVVIAAGRALVELIAQLMHAAASDEEAMAALTERVAANKADGVHRRPAT
jgi:hypothetical protein